MGFIDLDIGMMTQDSVVSMPGSATVVLPIRGGIDIPYPFVPPTD